MASQQLDFLTIICPYPDLENKKGLRLYNKTNKKQQTYTPLHSSPLQRRSRRGCPPISVYLLLRGRRVTTAANQWFQRSVPFPWHLRSGSEWRVSGDCWKHWLATAVTCRPHDEDVHRDRRTPPATSALERRSAQRWACKLFFVLLYNCSLKTPLRLLFMMA